MRSAPNVLVVNVVARLESVDEMFLKRMSQSYWVVMEDPDFSENSQTAAYLISSAYRSICEQVQPASMVALR